MFNLFRTRDKAVRYLLGTLLGLVAISMVVTMIPGFGSETAPPEQVIAEIGDEAVTAREVQATIRSAVKAKSIPAEMVQFYMPQLVDQMITERALAYQARRMGFSVPEADLANAIRSMMNQLFQGGEFNKQLYARFLADQNLTIPEFERNVEKNLLLLKLQSIALEGVIVTKEELEKEYLRRNEQVKVEYVSLSPANLKAGVQVTAEEARDHFNKNKPGFQTNEKRSFDMLLADQTKMAATFQIPEAELRRSYETNRERYRTQERARVRHILIKTMEKPKEEAGALEAKAKDILKQVRGGADFAELARKHSEDPGSAVKGGDLDWIARGQTVAAFEKAVFSLPLKQVSDLVRTEFGFHIMQVTERETGRLRPFEEVKPELSVESTRQAVNDKMQNAMDQARAELIKAPQQGQAIADKNGLLFVQVREVASGESMPEAGASSEMYNAVASLKPGEVSQVAQVTPTRLAIGVLTAVKPTGQATYEEVESRVREQVKDQKAQQLADARVKEAADKLKALNGDLRALGKAMNLEVKTAPAFNQDGAAEGIGPASYLTEAFTKPVGSTIGPLKIGEETFLVRVAEKLPADMAKFAAEREALVLSLKKKKAAERKDLFEDGVLAQLIKEGKVKKYPEAIKRLGAAMGA